MKHKNAGGNGTRRRIDVSGKGQAMMLVFIFLFFGVLIASCVFLGISPGYAGRHMVNGTYQDCSTGTSVRKEVVAGEIKAAATFPPVEAGRGQVATLTLRNRTSLEPITGAEVYFHAWATRTTDTSATCDVVESSEHPGTYTASYGPLPAGKWDLLFHVASDGKQKLHPGLVIGTMRTLGSAVPSWHPYGMIRPDWLGGISFLIGAVLMGAMTIFMFSRGRMF